MIVVSQLTEPEAIQRCLAAGANAYHSKPVRRAALVDTTKDYLKPWQTSASPT